MGIQLSKVARVPIRPTSGALVTIALLSGCGSSSAATAAGSPTIAASAPTPAGATTATVGTPQPVNPAAIPLGDGHVSTTPRVGYVDSCSTSFGGGGGAQAVGPWIDTAHSTWNSLTKATVAGAVTWPNASYSVTTAGDRRVIGSNDLPGGHSTGVYPVAGSDPAYAYDRNPNVISVQSINWSLPLNPTAASGPSCTPGGPIGVLSDGVVLFNALDGEGRDAVAHEVLDSCDEHPEMTGLLHHHDVPACILAQATGTSTLVGYATDGYGIYVERNASGGLLTNADLDACHGRTSTVTWNGTSQSVFHYVATREYPYTVGCFHGSPIANAQPDGPPGGGPPH